jgi:hypothetical protein
MTANINPKTGIAYGVVSLNSLQDWVFEHFVNHGENVSQKARHDEFRKEWAQNNPDLDETSPEFCDAEQEFCDNDQSEDDTYSLETHDGMVLGLSTLGGAYLVWVFQSPHVNENCAYCSPCCPNAGDLDNTGNYQAYTLPADWFYGSRHE